MISAKKPEWHLRLYVAGEGPKAQKAIRALKQVCDEHLEKNCEIEIIDVFNNPEIAMRDHIIATPTIVRRLPPPVRKIIGDFADKEKLLVGLEILKEKDQSSSE